MGALQHTIADATGPNPHHLAQIIESGYAHIDGTTVRVVVGQGEAVNGIPLNVLLVDRT